MRRIAEVRAQIGPRVCSGLIDIYDAVEKKIPHLETSQNDIINFFTKLRFGKQKQF